MNSSTQKRPTWSARFSARGGLSLVLAVVVAPLVIYAFHQKLGFDWTSSVILGVPTSVVVGYLLIFPLFFLPVTLWLTFFHRGRCPNCQRRGVRGGLYGPDPELTGNAEPFIWSECDYCHYQFWQWRGQTTVHHIAPTDSRYVRVK